MTMFSMTNSFVIRLIVMWYDISMDNLILLLNYMFSIIVDFNCFKTLIFVDSPWVILMQSQDVH